MSGQIVDDVPPIPYNTPLSLLLNTEFYEDWDEEHGSPGGVIRAFREHYSPADVQRCQEQLADVLALDVAERERIYRTTSCRYWIDTERSSVTEFLEWVQRALGEPLDGPVSQPPDFPPDYPPGYRADAPR